MFLFFCFHTTPTTEIYPNSHPLALLAALPIFMAVINTNGMSLNTQRNLSSSQGMLQTAMQRLSSGLRINSAKDDAAGLAISDRMTAQIRGLRSEEHTSELQSLMRISYAVFCLKKKKKKNR